MRELAAEELVVETVERSRREAEDEQEVEVVEAPELCRFPPPLRGPPGWTPMARDSPHERSVLRLPGVGEAAAAEELVAEEEGGRGEALTH